MRMSDTNPIIVTVPEEFANQRMDKVLSQLFNQYSRSQLQRWIKSGNVSVNGKQLKAKEKLYGGEEILLLTKQKESLQDLPEKIPLECVYEDSHILVVNKPVGLVVHPGAGNRTYPVAYRTVARLISNPGACLEEGDLTYPVACRTVARSSSSETPGRVRVFTFAVA